MQDRAVKAIAIQVLVAVAAVVPCLHAQEPAALFAAGTQALHDGNLDQAETDFKGVLRLDPSSAAAYSNLGVIAMRKKQWTTALERLHKAEHLDPSMAGVRLNVGLVYYRMNDFSAAAKAFSSLLASEPSSAQGRYLFGLSSFFSDQYAEAEKALLPLWPTYSTSLSYLYVLGSAAHKTADVRNESRAFQQMELVGQSSTGQATAELHLYAGKAALNKQDYAAAERELNAAVAVNPKLPMAHYFRAEVLSSESKDDAARTDLLAEIQLEPNVAYSYDALGRVEQRLQHPEDATRAFEQALKLDPSLGTAYVGLAQLDRDGHQYDKALVAIDHALLLQPSSASTHYLRGQILARLNRGAEAKIEFTRTNELLQAVGERMKPGAMDAPATTSHAADAQFTQSAAQE